MTKPPPPSPADTLGTLSRWPIRAILRLGGGEWFAAWVMRLIADLIRDLEQALARLAAQLAAGPCPPRASATTPPATDPEPGRRHEPSQVTR